jgi:hypothetical protein
MLDVLFGVGWLDLQVGLDSREGVEQGGGRERVCILVVRDVQEMNGEEGWLLGSAAVLGWGVFSDKVGAIIIKDKLSTILMQIWKNW